MKREWNIRTIYLYLVSFVTLMMIIFGTVQLIQSAVAFVYPPPAYYPGPADIKMRMANEKLEPEVIEEQVRFEQERQEQQIKYDRARRVAESFSLLLVALPIYLYHWRRIQRDAGTPS
ncbi:hypothetical protein SY88_21920 [Clostridiales bacterium PH28_bin88]|nr:hypothetical protein SY88_21920 [Clostridiales bacterium PH28_bin88]